MPERIEMDVTNFGDFLEMLMQHGSSEEEATPQE